MACECIAANLTGTLVFTGDVTAYRSSRIKCSCRFCPDGVICYDTDMTMLHSTDGYKDPKHGTSLNGKVSHRTPT